MPKPIEIGGIDDELLTRLDERANQVGVNRDVFVRRLIERAVAPPSSWQSLSEFLAPVHDFTEAHGISESDLELFLTEQVSAARRERRQ
jgi:hypothetical protein